MEQEQGQGDVASAGRCAIGRPAESGVLCMLRVLCTVCRCTVFAAVGEGLHGLASRYACFDMCGGVWFWLRVFLEGDRRQLVCCVL